MFRPSCRGAVAFSDHNSCACQPQKPQSPIRIAVSCGTGVTVTERFLGELLIRPAEVGSIDGSSIRFAHTVRPELVEGPFDKLRANS